mmetsp:Transcript_19211/g.48383  ORF Transcript_19211/g.48383 Transcript_19211/m.48383 type:complete len:221 (-) Transcript_19211:224-886(-)
MRPAGRLSRVTEVQREVEQRLHVGVLVLGHADRGLVLGGVVVLLQMRQAGHRACLHIRQLRLRSAHLLIEGQAALRFHPVDSGVVAHDRLALQLRHKLQQPLAPKNNFLRQHLRDLSGHLLVALWLVVILVDASRLDDKDEVVRHRVDVLLQPHQQLLLPLLQLGAAFGGRHAVAAPAERALSRSAHCRPKLRVVPASQHRPLGPPPPTLQPTRVCHVAR